MMYIDLNDSSAAVIQSLGQKTGLTITEVVNKLVGGHLAELYELERLLDSCKHDPVKYPRAQNLLQSYGPEPLMDGIGRVAPDHMTEGERIYQAASQKGR